MVSYKKRFEISGGCMEKIKVAFVCFGNICRSPMAEFLMKDLVKERGRENAFEIASFATNGCEEGSPVYYGTAKILNRLGIDFSDKRAIKLRASDYGKYDYFIGMDESNARDMKRIFGGDPQNKVSLLMDYTSEKRDVADPWYTRDFEKTFTDVVRGTRGFYDYLSESGKI